MVDIDKIKLDDLSDFKQRFYYNVPFLKFNGKEGTFTLLKRDDVGEIKEAQDLGKEIQVVFLKRGRFKLVSGRYYSSEAYPKKGKMINLYQIDKKTGKRMLVDVGEWQEIKSRYGLKTQQLPFVLLLPEKEIVKLKIIPGSLQSYWDYLATFRGKERPYEFITKISSVEEEGKEGGVYYKLSFEKVKPVENLEEIARYIDEVASNLKKEEEVSEETPPPPEESLLIEPEIEEEEEEGGEKERPEWF